MSTTCVYCGEPAQADLTDYMLDWLQFRGLICKDCFLGEVTQYALDSDPQVSSMQVHSEMYRFLYETNTDLCDPRSIIWEPMTSSKNL